MSEMKYPRKRRRKRNAQWEIPVITLLIVLAVGVLLGMKLSDNSKSSSAIVLTATMMPTATPKRLEVDQNAGALITPTPVPQEPGIVIPGWGELKIPAGVTEVQTAFRNPEANADWYYLSLELRLKDSGETIFTTGLIPPGQYCNKVTLTRPLKKGEYAAIMHVQPYKMDESQTPTNDADVETVLIVE